MHLLDVMQSGPFLRQESLRFRVAAPLLASGRGSFKVRRAPWDIRGPLFCYARNFLIIYRSLSLY